jgi:uncharacterized protein YegP (UPF0339 family)
MKFIIFQEVDGLWHWRLIAEDENVAAVSSIGTLYRDSVFAAVDVVQQQVLCAPVYDSTGML